jgi:GNAT superfamily N-acetyltransferase
VTDWTVRELAAEETYALRRAVSADGRSDLPTMHHELDDRPGAWHLGAVAISSLYPVASPFRPEARPAVQLQFMAVDPALQGRGIGSDVLAEIVRRLKATGTVLLWASARDAAVPFYERFGFKTVDGSAFTHPRQAARTGSSNSISPRCARSIPTRGRHASPLPPHLADLIRNSRSRRLHSSA